MTMEAVGLKREKKCGSRAIYREEQNLVRKGWFISETIRVVEV